MGHGPENWGEGVCRFAHSRRRPPPITRQAARRSNDHPSVTKGKRLMVIQAVQDLDPDLSGEPLAKMVKTDNIK